MGLMRNVYMYIYSIMKVNLSGYMNQCKARLKFDRKS